MRRAFPGFAVLAVAFGGACGNGTNLSVGSTGAPDASAPSDDAPSFVDASSLDAAVDVLADAPPADVEVGCTPGATKSCYSGPAGTAGVGTCLAGTATCATNGKWGPCIGEVVPRPDVCGGPDSNCDGMLPSQSCPGNVPTKFQPNTGWDGNAMRIAVDPTSRHVVVLGQFNTSVDFGLGPLTPLPGIFSTYMLTLDSTLKPIAQFIFGGQSSADLHIDTQGNRFVYLQVSGGLVADFGMGPISNANGVEAFAVYDPTGKNVLWQKTVPDAYPNTETPRLRTFLNGRGALAIDAPYDYGCGVSTTMTGTVLGLAPGGACTWETPLPAGVIIWGMAAQSDGSNVMIATYDGKNAGTLGTTTLRKGSPKTLIFSLDAAGAIKWTTVLDASLGADNVAVGPSDEIYVSGDCAAPTLDLGGGPLPLLSTAFGGDDLVIARFDAGGHYVWGKRLPGDAAGGYTQWLGAGATAIFLAGGARQGHVSFGGTKVSPSFLASLDRDGNYRWSVAEYTDSVQSGAIDGTSFVYTTTNAGNVWQFLY